MSRTIVAERAAAARRGEYTPSATFRVRRPRGRAATHRFRVSMVDHLGEELIGGAETLRDAVDLALSYMGHGDTLDVTAVI